MLLKENTFIKDEGGAPLLKENHFYLHKHADIAWEKTRIWHKLLLNRTNKDEIKTDTDHDIKDTMAQNKDTNDTKDSIDTNNDDEKGNDIEEKMEETEPKPILPIQALLNIEIPDDDAKDDIIQTPFSVASSFISEANTPFGDRWSSWLSETPKNTNTDKTTSNMNSDTKQCKYGLKIVLKPDRIIVKDAERNFVTLERQQLLITVLEALKSLFNDYQQTMASIAGILLLFFDAKTVFEMMFMLARNPKYNMEGYWRYNAVKQGIDIYVLYNILQSINPLLYHHLKKYNVLSGWIQPHFGGLSVQTMPIKHLIEFWTHLFGKGLRYLFKYILSLLQILSPLLLVTNTTDKLMSMLRCNRKSKFWKCCDFINILSNDEKVSVFFENVLDNIQCIDKEYDIDNLDLQKEREIAFTTYLSQSLLDAALNVTFKEFEIQSGNDSEIKDPMDCAQCDDACADVFCTECDIYLCDQCYNDSANQHKSQNHPFKQLYIE